MARHKHSFPLTHRPFLNIHRALIIVLNPMLREGWLDGSPLLVDTKTETTMTMTKKKQQQ